MRGKVLVLISALALAHADRVRLNQNGCPIDVTVNAELLPHQNCNQYYQCERGELVTRNCPSNLFFNSDTKSCDRSENVNCYRETYGVIRRDITYNSDPKQASAICDVTGSDGILVAHEHCNQFYQCWNGRPVAVSCYGHLHYNPILEICDWPQQVDCGERIIPESTDGSEHDNNPDETPMICATEGTEELLLMHHTCNKFYKCHEGKPVTYKCPGHLLYNPVGGYCDCADNVSCDDRVIEENYEENGDSNASEEHENNNGNDDPSQAPSICTAEGSDGVLVAHEYCNKFYKCTHGIPIEFICYGELLFNPALEHCEWPDNVDCGDRIIPENSEDQDNEDSESKESDLDNESNEEENITNNEGNNDPSQAPAICAASDSESVLVAHENCNQFYICAGGRPIALDCPSNLLFNPSTNQCNWPNNVDCGDRVIPEEVSEEDNDSNNENNSTGDGSTEISSSENGGSDNGSNDDPSQAPIICAVSGSDSVLVAHENCNQFYICSGGKPVVLDCPASLLFNPNTGQCDWPENIDCGDRIIPEIESEEDDNGGSDNGGTENGSSEDGGSDNGGDGDNNGNTGNGNDDPSLAPIICAAENSESVLVAHENCNQFYICLGGKPVVLDCPANLLFNPNTDQCDWPENVDCGDRIIPEIESEEDDNGGSDNEGTGNGSSEDGGPDNGGDGDNNGNTGNGHDDPSLAPIICAADNSESVLVAHENCNQFYICLGGKPIALECPGSLLFNPNTDQCDWPENVSCGDRVIPEIESEEDNNGGNDNGGTENGSSEDGGPDNGGDGDNNGNTGNGHDDPSQAPIICAADNSESVLVAHENCNQFYICLGGKPIALECPGSLLFNPNTDQCDWPENVNCGDRVIPEIESEEDNNGGSDNGGTENGSSEDGGPDNGGDGDHNGNTGNGHDDPSQAPIICAADNSESVLVAHENCNQFYICLGGKPIALECPGSLLFNPNTDQCDWPENVNCGDRVIPEIESEEDNNGGNDNGGTENGSSEDGGPDNGGDGDNNGNTGNGHDDPSQAPIICAADNSESVLVAHENCNQFYICLGGKPIALECPGSLLFNPNTDQCDWPENVSCGDRVIPEIESEEDNNGGNDNGGTENGSSEDGGPDNGGDGDHDGNTGNGHDDPSQAPIICAADNSESVLVAHENCNQFYICLGGKPIALECPGSLLFNPNTDQCDWPENVSCGDRVIPEIESEEDNNGGNDNGGTENGSSEDGGPDNGGDGDHDGNTGNGHDDPSQAPIICAADNSESVLVAHENCNQFYICLGGKPIALECPGSLLFNPNTDQCDWPENVNCGDRVIPEIESEEDNNGGSDNGGTENGSSEDGGPDNGGDGDNNGNTGNGHDDPSQAPIICAADDSEGVLVAHENCNQFYICLGGKPVVLDCPANLLFNPNTDQCDWLDNVDCGDRIIPEIGSGEDNNGGSDNGSTENGSSEDGGSDNGGDGDNNGNTGNGHDNPSQAPIICAADGSEGVLIAHENCNQFYICLGGKPVVLDCPANLLFNPNTDQCDWPDNVNCGDRVIPEIESEEDNNGGSDNGSTENGSSEDEGSDNGDDGDNNGNTGNGYDDPSQAPIICAADGSENILVAHENCNQFYICLGGKPAVLDCPASLLFNPDTDQCDWPDNVDCGDRIIPEIGSGEDNNGGSDNGSTENGSSEDGGPDNGGDGDNNGNTGNGHDDPSQAPIICAADGSEGVLVAHENCNQFQICLGGKPVVLDCPANLLFNPNTDQCDWPENVNCGDRVIPEIESEEDNDGGSDNGSTENGSSEDEGSDNGGDGDNNGNTGNGHDDPSQAPAICAADGSENILVAHDNCNQFYVCLGGKPVALDCPTSLLFNPNTDQCDWPENVDCGDRVIPEIESEEDNNGGSGNGSTENGSSEDGGPDNNGDGDNNGNTGNGHDDPSQAPIICAADGSEGVLVAHENCNQFHICLGGKPVVLDCPANLLFNPNTDQCDWPENVNCGDRVIPEIESEEDNDGGSDNGSTENGSSEDEGSDNGGDGDNNGNTGNGHDDPSQAPAICAADGSDNILVAHDNCNQFYVCLGGKPIALDCPTSLLFNPNTDQCDWPENVDCGDRVIPEIESEEDNNGGSDNGSTENGSSEDEESDNDGDGDNNGNTGNGHDDPSQAPAICAADGSENVLVAHENCNQFYVCLGGKPVSLECPTSLLFNPNTDQCDWPENVDCGDRVIPEIGSEEDDNGGSDNGSTENGSSEDGGSDNDGDGDNNGNTGNGHDDPSQAPAICAADGSENVLVAHENCNQFYVCLGSKPIALECPTSLLFNPNTDQCDWPENVDCGDRVISEIESEEDNNGGSDNGGTENGSSEDDGSDNGGDGDNTGNGHDDPSQAPAICAADGSENVFVAHENCNQYYVCIGGRPVELDCPKSLLFNPYTDQCDWPANVICGDRVIPEIESEEDDNGGSDNGSTENGSSEDGGSDNGGGGDNNGNTGNGHDDPSQAAAICAADGSENVLVAHENCNQYYICIGGRPTALDCPANLLFNPNTDQCDWPKNVNCGDRVIPENESKEDSSLENGSNEDNGNGGNNGNGNDNPSAAPVICATEGSEGVFVAHENCNQFYVCKGGVPVSLDCPSGLLYNPSIEQCDWAENVSCEDRIIPETDSEEDNSEGDDNDNTENGSTEDSGNGDNDNNGNGHEATTICAVPGSEGIFIAHENCSQFYVCIEENPIVIDCPLGLMYDPITQVCDWPHNVNCSGRFVPDDETDDSHTEGDNDGNGEDGAPITDPIQISIICQSDGSEGIFLAHRSCNQFYVCVGSEPVVLDCPENLLYDYQAAQCDWPEKVDCTGRLLPGDIDEDDDNNAAIENLSNEDDEAIIDNNLYENSVTTCADSASTGLFLPHEDCDKFYMCLLNRPTVLQCATGLLFASEKKYCDWAETVDCGSRARTILMSLNKHLDGRKALRNQT